MQLHHQQFAYRKTYQAHEEVSLLRLMIEKAAGWQRSLIIIDGDVWKAYDRLRHKPLAVTLTRRGVVRMVTAALIREVRCCSSTFQMDSVRSQRVRRERSLWQGDPGAPTWFGVVLDDEVCERFERRAQQKKWGFPIGTTRVSLLWFADNFW